MISINFDPTPRPVASYAELWGRDPKTLNAWCAKGWIPGAFQHPSGQWWVRPLDLLGFDPLGQVEETLRLKRAGGVPKHPERLKFPGVQ